MFSLFIDKLKPIVITLIILAAAAMWLSLWISDEKAEAVAEAKQQIEAATQQQVIEDEKIVSDAYQPSDAIDDAVDRMLDAEPTKASGSDRLLSPGTSAGTPERSEASVSVGTPNELSDQEIEFITENSGLLQ